MAVKHLANTLHDRVGFAGLVMLFQEPEEHETREQTGIPTMLKVREVVLQHVVWTLVFL